MKKIFFLLSAFVLTLGLQSCIDEEGAGTPMLKKMHLEAAEYTIDLTDEDQTKTDIVLRWIDVQNATYKVSLSDDVTETRKDIAYQQVPGALNTLSMTIPYADFVEYAQEAEIAVQDEEVTKTENGEEKTYTRLYQMFNLNVTGTPVDTSVPSGLAPEGSTATATVKLIISIEEQK